MLQTVVWLIMGGAFAGMWWANRLYRTKGVLWGRPLAVLCGFCSIGLAFLSMALTYTNAGSGLNVDALQKKYQKIQYVAYKMFGQELAKRYPGESILLINRYVVVRSEKAKQGNQLRVDAFKDGLGGQAKLGAVEDATSGIENGDEEIAMTAEQRELVAALALTPERFDELVVKHPDCKVVVSLLGLPPDMREVEKMKLWKMSEDERPAVALADANVHYLKPVIRDGFISVVLHRKPLPVDPNDPLPETEAKIFDTMYMLITAESLDKISAEFPKLFSSREE